MPPLTENFGLPPGVRTGGALMALTGTVTFADTTAKPLGTLPAGSRIVDIKVDVVTAFNSSGTDLLDIGKSGTANHFTNDQVVSVAGRMSPTLTNLGRQAATTVVVAQYIQSVADATTGSAVITILFTAP